MIDGAVLVFHDARIISFVGRDYALHDETPVLVADLVGLQTEIEIFPSTVSPFHPPKQLFSQINPSFVVQV